MTVNSEELSFLIAGVYGVKIVLARGVVALDEGRCSWVGTPHLWFVL